MINSRQNAEPLSHHANSFGYNPNLFLPQWSTCARVSVFSIGIFCLLLSSQLKGHSKKLLSIFGISSLVRSLSNRHVTDIIGWIANPTVQLRRTIEIHSEIQDVYEFLSDFNNFPSFMSYIKQVEVDDLGGLRWTVQGPAGILLHWNTSLGKLTLNQMISWKSTSNSIIRNSGEIRVTEIPNQGTKIDIELNYAPPIGALGYAVVNLLGFNPKDKIDQDLNTLKSMIENQFPLHQELVSYHKAKF